MKKFILRTMPFLIAGFVFIGCGKGDEKEDGFGTYARFRQSEAQVAAHGGEISLMVEWSRTEWTLSTGEGSLITGVSITGGGDPGRSDSYTGVKVTYGSNPSIEARSQEIMVKNLSDGTSHSIRITQDAGEPVKLTLNPSVKYQHVTGFGGMLNASGWVERMTESDIDVLFGPGGLGYNILRIMIYPNQNKWEHDVALAKRAQEYGAIILASPWTPPAEMKTNKNQVGGRLDPARYADYAAHLKAFVDFFKERGVDIYAVSVQNEPDIEVSYDGCEWTPTEIMNFVKEYGRSIGEGVKLLAAESFNFKQAYTNPLLNDAEAVECFDIVGGHLYGGGLADYPLARQKGKEVWMTEHLWNEGSEGVPAGYDWQWTPSLNKLAKEIHDCMEANFNAYIWWYLRRHYSMVGDTDSKSLVPSGEVTKRGYMMAHYAGYAAGKDRIEVKRVSGSAFLLTTAYSGAGEMTAVLINTRDELTHTRIELPETALSVSAVETTEYKDMQNITASLSSDKKSIDLTLAGKSVVSVSIRF